MKMKGYSVALVSALVAGIGLLNPAASQAATVCNGTLGAVTIQGNLTIGPGNNCVLNGTTVTGNVVQTGGTLTATNPTIQGSLTVTGTATGSRNEICGGFIGGSANVSGVSDTTGGFFRLLGTGANRPPGPDCTVPLRVGGSVNFHDNPGFVRLSNASVGGSVRFTNNTSEFYGTSVVVTNNSIAGSLSCTGNTPPVTFGGNTTGGSKSGQCTAPPVGGLA